MKKIFKKLIILFSCFALLINSLPLTVFASEINEKKLDKAMQKLVASGWDMNEAQDIFPEEDLLKISDAINIKSTTNYYMVRENINDNTSEVTSMSKKDCLNAVEHKKNDTISSYASDTQNTADGYFTNTITLSTYTTGTYLVSYSFKWLIAPYNRQIDAFAFFVDQLTVSSVLNKYYQADYYIGNTFIKTDIYTPAVKTSAHGIGMEIDLYNDGTLGTSTGTYKNHRGYASFSAVRNTTGEIVASAWGEYYHNEFALSLSPGLAVADLSVSFSLSSILKEMLPNPYAYVRMY